MSSLTENKETIYSTPQVPTVIFIHHKTRAFVFECHKMRVFIVLYVLGDKIPTKYIKLAFMIHRYQSLECFTLQQGKTRYFVNLVKNGDIRFA